MIWPFVTKRDAYLRPGEGCEIMVSMQLAVHVPKSFHFAIPDLSFLKVGTPLKLNAPLLAGRRYGEVIEVSSADGSKHFGTLDRADTAPRRELLYSLNYERHAVVQDLRGRDGQSICPSIDIAISVRRRIFK